jgi:hypothetical protein
VVNGELHVLPPYQRYGSTRRENQPAHELRTQSLLAPYEVRGCHPAGRFAQRPRGARPAVAASASEMSEYRRSLRASILSALARFKLGNPGGEASSYPLAGSGSVIRGGGLWRHSIGTFGERDLLRQSRVSDEKADSDLTRLQVRHSGRVARLPVLRLMSRPLLDIRSMWAHGVHTGVAHEQGQHRRS